MDDNTDIVDRLRSMYYELSRRQASTPFGERSELDGIPTLLYEAAIKIQDLRGNEIQRLRKERDEARRELCAAKRELCRDEAIIRLQRNRVHRDSEDVVGLAKEIAVERGWDCFKENKGLIDSAMEADHNNEYFKTHHK
jgi:hypothetical protein